jgi:hypothetical protein
LGKTDKRHVRGTVEQRIFEGLSKMIAVRSNTQAHFKEQLVIPPFHFYWLITP